MTHDDQTERPLDRRLLLRGGAVLAGAAGVTVIGAAMGTSAAQAADGGSVLIGKANAGTATTALTVGAGATPALTLTNTNGPGLRLNSLPDSFDNNLAIGDLAGSDLGPLVGVDDGDGGSETSFLLTANDLALIPVAEPKDVPTRLLDTRNAAGRTGILRSSSASAIDSTGRLTANSWIDVKVDRADSVFELTGVFVNVAVISPTANGYLTVYPPGDRPNTSTINFRSAVALSNGAFLALGTLTTSYIVRIHSSQTTHVLLDYSGSVVSAASEPPAMSSSVDAKRRTARQNKRASVLKAKLTRSAG